MSTPNELPPGEWRYEPSDSGNLAGHIFAGDMQHARPIAAILLSDEPFGPNEEAHANGRLMAAAKSNAALVLTQRAELDAQTETIKELTEALEAIMSRKIVHSMACDVVKQARAALDKARATKGGGSANAT